ncbi:hypothetical protein P154DRAFT_145374 [Amniculicola lignicola CBS 123094]|uniref:Uncharacterized protein n=1 Tax=Amniculicola lignicola CBS 123094 TaxID=1392246 RepID=A0A6A5WMS0_9PLEO|nr:hypothetical protein P154DRAFT_145374 [Amniculicola lignicola CBS 123094]
MMVIGLDGMEKVSWFVMVMVLVFPWAWGYGMGWDWRSHTISRHESCYRTLSLSIFFLFFRYSRYPISRTRRPFLPFKLYIYRRQGRAVYLSVASGEKTVSMVKYAHEYLHSELYGVILHSHMHWACIRIRMPICIDTISSGSYMHDPDHEHSSCLLHTVPYRTPASPLLQIRKPNSCNASVRMLSHRCYRCGHRRCYSFRTCVVRKWGVRWRKK